MIDIRAKQTFSAEDAEAFWKRLADNAVQLCAMMTAGGTDPQRKSVDLRAVGQATMPAEADNAND